MPFSIPQEIHSQRLLLRPVLESDLPELLEVNGEPDVTQYLPYATWTTVDDGRILLTRAADLLQTKTGVYLVLTLKDTGGVIGTCILFRYDEVSQLVELGYVLGKKHWGSGLMKEALTAVIGVLFASGCVRRIEAEINPANLRSSNTLQGLGFQKEGLLRQRRNFKGNPSDSVLLGLLHSDWAKLSS